MIKFDRILIVDWSANNVPKTGKDSIWIASVECADGSITFDNPSTRHAAMGVIEDAIEKSVEFNQKIFVGFDFAFGYPAGSDFLPGEGSWEELWEWLHNAVRDDEKNRSNRFEVAGQLNLMCETGEGPFWGHPQTHADRYPGLGPKRPNYQSLGIPERRSIDNQIGSAQPVWKLAYAGSVGSQTILGIAHLQALRVGRFKDKIAIWPFETGFAKDLSKQVILAELYPSMFEVTANSGEVLDCAQVRTVAEAFQRFNAAGEFERLLDGPRQLGEKVRRRAIEREAWMAGFADEIVRLDGPTESNDYIRDPAEIYRQSFATVEREARLEELPDDMQPVATRLIHSCGMVDVIDDLDFSVDAVAAGKAALDRGCKIFCDVEMVKAGIIEKFLIGGASTVCTLNDAAIPAHAKKIANTRSAAAVDFWDGLEGSIIVIGNAPTALFRLLERVDEGAGKPALVIGIPVGFVGAVESKRALADNNLGLEFITVHGRRGGSAMASSVVNALTVGLNA